MAGQATEARVLDMPPPAPRPGQGQEVARGTKRYLKRPPSSPATCGPAFWLTRLVSTGANFCTVSGDMPSLEKTLCTSPRLLGEIPPSSGPAALVISEAPGMALLTALN